MEQTVVRIRTLEIGSGMPKICVPVVGKTEKEILGRRAGEGCKTGSGGITCGLV